MGVMINTGKEWSWMDRYPDGYLPKIQYWAKELTEAAYLNESHRIPHIMEKLIYFTKKQEEKDGKRI